MAKESLAELAELAESAGVVPVDWIIQHRHRIDPHYLLGRGKLDEVTVRGLQVGADLLIFDQGLTPVQSRSIAERTELKVIDRTMLILDIFAQHAHSREGKIQVELAQLKYLMPYLSNKGTALSRLAGGRVGSSRKAGHFSADRSERARPARSDQRISLPLESGDRRKRHRVSRGNQ